MAPGDVTPPGSDGQDGPSASLRVIVADDDALLREGIAALLEDAGHRVVGRARDAPDLLLKVRSYVPDIAIVDVRMPPRNLDDGLLAAVEIRRSHPAVSVLVLSQHVEPAYMLELVGDDASGVGYLLKDRVRDVAEFLDAVERVAAGGTAFDPAVVNSLVAGHRRSVLDDLTDRERDVLSLIAEGRSNKAIAGQLYLSSRVIERHVQAIFEKLRLPDTDDSNRRVLAVLALLRTLTGDVGVLSAGGPRLAVEHAHARVALAVIEQPLALVGDEALDEDDVVHLAGDLLGGLGHEERLRQPRELLGRLGRVDQRLAGAVDQLAVRVVRRRVVDQQDVAVLGDQRRRPRLEQPRPSTCPAAGA